MALDQDKQYQRIGDAAKALNLKTCVLRFWEDEFPQLRPHRTPKGQRLYSGEDMEMLFRIRSLLHEQGMTIDGARRILSGKQPLPVQPASDVSSQEPAVADSRAGGHNSRVIMEEAARELESLHALLVDPYSANTGASSSEHGASPKRPVFAGLTPWER